MSDPRCKHLPAAWRDPLDQWATAMASASISKDSIATRTDHLRRIARAMRVGPWLVTTGQLTAWSGSQVWARETRRSVHTSARKFWAWAMNTGLTDHNPAEGLPRVKAAEPMPRPCPTPVANAAIADADHRVALILRCALDVGMRRGEIAQVHSSDLTRDLVGWSLLVHGKGGRDRIVPLPISRWTWWRPACGVLAGGRSLAESTGTYHRAELGSWRPRRCPGCGRCTRCGMAAPPGCTMPPMI